MAHTSQPHVPAEPDPEATSGARAEGAASRTLHEDAILAIWRDVLHRADIDVSDDFFTVGDPSLVPAVVARIRKSFGVDIPVTDIFEARTVTALASLVAARSSSALQAVPPRPPDAEPMLSFDQQRIWMETQLLPDGAYNNHARRRLVGQLDVATMERSIRAIIGRHETLRSRFPTVSGRPVPLVDDTDPHWRLRVVDVTDVHGDRTVAAVRLLDEDATGRVDLAEGPLFRIMLVKVSDAEHILGLTMHQIISDSHSIYAFERELGALYQAGGDVDRAGLPALSIQYRDFAVWQRKRLAGATLDRLVGYWRRHLEGAPPILALPTAQRRTAIQGAESDRVDLVLSREGTAALHDLCRTHDVTPFMVLLTGLATIFGRWSGQSDVVIGTAFEGRTDSEVDKLIGIFFNILPFRMDLSGDPTFVELLGRARRVALDGYENSQAPIDVVVADLQVPRDPRRTPVFEVVLNVTAPPDDSQVPGLAVEWMGTSQPRTRFDLFINAQEYAGCLRLTFDFAAARFDRAMIQLLADHLGALLGQVVEDPTKSILDYPLGPTPDAGSGPVPADLTEPMPHVAVDRQAQGPKRAAVVDAYGEWSYSWLSEAADRVARELARREVRAGDRIGVVLRPAAGFVAALLGSMKAGATVTVVEGSDPLGARSRGLSTVVDVSPPDPLAEATIDLSAVVRETIDPPAPRAGPESSVSTRDWAVDQFGLSRDDRFAVLSSEPGHVVSALSSAVHAGATLVIPDGSVNGDAGTLATWLRTNAISVLLLTPPVLRALAAQAQPSSAALPALKCVFVDNAGEFLPHDVEALRALSPDCRCVGIYRVGPDGRPLATYVVPDDWRVDMAPLRVSLGVGLPNRPVAVVDAGGRAVATGEVGEICFGSSRTGDLGRRWPDGSLEFVRRVSASPIVEPIETVATLREMPGVRDAVVIERIGPDGGNALRGYVAGSDGQLQAVRVTAFLRARLPGYLIPEHIVVLDQLPLTPGGDYDLDALPDPDAGAEPDYVAPRTPLERELTDVVEELLDIDRVGVHDSFFELGGFSLLATQLTTRIRSRYNVEFGLRDIFESPTIDGLAQLIVRAQGELSGTAELEALLDEIERSADPRQSALPDGARGSS
jgi:non-ribosomal peptide synthetase component F/acyl carrier protein